MPTAGLQTRLSATNGKQGAQSSQEPGTQQEPRAVTAGQHGILRVGGRRRKERQGPGKSNNPKIQQPGKAKSSRLRLIKRAWLLFPEWVGALHGPLLAERMVPTLRLARGGTKGGGGCPPNPLHHLAADSQRSVSRFKIAPSSTRLVAVKNFTAAL